MAWAIALGALSLPLPAAAQVPDGELEALTQLVAHGQYVAAESKLREQRENPLARVLLARVLLETGRYAQAAEEAALVSATDAARGPAQTVLAEIQLAQGQLDAAEQTLRPLLMLPDSSRARVLLGRLLLDRGKRAEAVPVLSAVQEDKQHGEHGAELCYVAMASRALGRFHDANDTFRAASDADPARVETQLEWAQLFLDKYDHKHAAQSVLAALAQNKHAALAHVLMARLQLLETLDFSEAEAALGRALADNPQLTAAHVTRATLALRDMDIPRAEQALAAALAINPNDLEALSVRAAARFLADDSAGFSALEQAVLKQNPHYSRFYSIVAEYAEWEHRYREIVAMAKRALAIDPGDARARATLGLNLLRLGEEPSGLAELHKAWEGDRFNVQVFNTLNLYDEVIRPNYEEFSVKPFRIRVHKQERKILEPYLVPMLRRAYDDMRTRYDVTPEGPLRIELYADRSHFSVRTTGLPNAGVQGVCFGKVVTALSPRGGPFNWGQIVWHELSHVFHLQLSKNHVPRWFTEGLAEYETVIARPEWKREDDYALYRSMQAEALPALANMNRVFTQAKKPEDLMTAYYFAYRAVEYIVQRFGMQHVRAMLVLFGEGKSMEQAVQSELGVSLDVLDHEFRAALQLRLAHFREEFQIDFSRFADVPGLALQAKRAPNDAQSQAALAMGEVLAKHYDEALVAGRAALKLDPKHKLAHFALARVALARRDARKAERCLRGIVQSGTDGYLLRMLLARGALARDNPADAVRELDVAVKIDPDRGEAWRLMLELSTQLGDETLALRAVRAIAELDQHDAIMHSAYLAMLVRARAWDDVVREGESALFLEPENAALHYHLGEGYVQTGKHHQGLVELDRALSLGYAKPGLVHLMRANAYLALHDKRAAQRAIEAAVAADKDLQPQADALGRQRD